MKIITMAASFTSALLLAGCAFSTTEYKAFEGKQGAIMEGNGGSKVVVDGMEIWDDGEPPRKFKILGFIDDNRASDLLPISSLRDDVVEEARKAGGNAVVKLHSPSQLTKFYAAGGASANAYAHSVFASSITMPERQVVSKYAVILYVK